MQSLNNFFKGAPNSVIISNLFVPFPSTIKLLRPLSVRDDQAARSTSFLSVVKCRMKTFELGVCERSNVFIQRWQTI